MSLSKSLFQHKIIREPLTDDGEQYKKVSLEKLRSYALMKDNSLKSRAYILAKIYQISSEDAEDALNLFNDYSKVLYFTDVILNELKINRADYMGALRRIKEEDLEFLKKQPISILEQETMAFQNKFGIDPNELEIKAIKEHGDLKPVFNRVKGRNVPSKKEFKFSLLDLDESVSREECSEITQYDV